VRISFCRVFELSTQELHYGEESKEEESEEEEVILRLGVAPSNATHEIGGWTYPAAFRLRDMRFDGHLGLFTQSDFSPDPPNFRFVLGAESRIGRQRTAAPPGPPICAPRTGRVHGINYPRHG
jgi:hypothetical protein